MNDQRVYEIPSIECCVVDDIAAHVLVRGEDGKLHASLYLALVCMVSIEDLVTA